MSWLQYLWKAILLEAVMMTVQAATMEGELSFMRQHGGFTTLRDRSVSSKMPCRSWLRTKETVKYQSFSVIFAMNTAILVKVVWKMTQFARPKYAEQTNEELPTVFRWIVRIRETHLWIVYLDRPYFYFYPHLTHSDLNVFWDKNSAQTKKFRKKCRFPMSRSSWNPVLFSMKFDVLL